MATVGIIASPTAGKDVRRLVANAGSVGDVDKIAVIRRAAVGAIEGGATRLLYLDDARHLVQRALDGLDATLLGHVALEPLALEIMGSSRDSVRAAAAMEKADVGSVLVFGGDGTSRDVAKGWLDAPIVPLAVGTNNVFPLTVEATLGGAAAGLVGAGVIDLEEAADRAKVIHVQIDDAETDLALVDVVLLSGGFIGSRAVWNVGDVGAAVFAIADPASVGLSAIGAAVRPTLRDHDSGVYVRTGDGQTVRVPVAPGTYADVGIAEEDELGFGETVVFEGPGVVAFDGERDHVLEPGQHATLTIRRDGPNVIDPVRVVRMAANRKLFYR